MLRLLNHQWKEKLRSPFWQKGIWLNLGLGVLMLYMLLNVTALGYFTDVFLKYKYKNADLVEVYTGLLFFYFVADILVRFTFQSLPVLSLKPYLVLPVRKSKLIHYILIKSIPSVFNFIPLLLILPFFFKVVCADRPATFCVAWILIVLSLVVTNNFLNFSLQKYFFKRPLLIALLIGISGAGLYFDFNHHSYFAEYFAHEFFYLCDNPAFIIPIAVSCTAYYVGYSLLLRNTYIEDKQSGRPGNSIGFTFLNRYGETGYLIRNELKLLLRNKRSRSMMIASLLGFIYFSITYHKHSYSSYTSIFLMEFFLTSLFALNYSSRVYSWESSFFDCLLSNNISPSNYIRSKYYLFGLASFTGFILSMPLVFFDYKILFINSAILLYNIGFTSVVILFLNTLNTTRIDLGRNQFMNYQGNRSSQYIMIIPLIGIPVLIQFLFYYLDILDESYLAYAVIGLACIFFRKTFLQIITSQFLKRKYKMALGFRLK